MLTATMLFVAYFLLVRIGREDDNNVDKNSNNWALRVPDNIAENCKAIRATWQED